VIYCRSKAEKEKNIYGGESMKHRILLLLLALVLVVSLVAFAACGGEEEPTTPAPTTPAPTTPAPTTPAPTTPAPVWEWPNTLPILCSSVESVGYASALTWSTLLADDTGMKVRLVCEEILSNKLRYLKEGRFFISVMSLSDAHMRAGTPDMSERELGAIQWRVVYPFSKINMGYAIRGDSDINSCYDLKGKKIGWVSTYGEPAKNLVRALLAWGNISDAEVTWVPLAGSSEFGPAIRDGTADICFANSTSSPGWYEVEAAPQGLKWMNLDPKEDPEGAKRFGEVFPASVTWGTIDGGVPSSLGVKSLVAIAPWATIDTFDEETVYQVVKWLDENYDRYKDLSPVVQSMTIDNLVAISETSWIPLHDGVVRYLEEMGMWSDAHEARRQQNIDLITKWEDAYQTAIGMAEEKGISVNAESEAWFELWTEYRDSLPYPSFKSFAGLD
jgi:TRAP transporter TAXI family solute receptor